MGVNPRLPWVTVVVVVVGIVKDMKQDGLGTDNVPHIFRPIYQQSGRRSQAMSVVARTPLPASLLESRIAGIQRALNERCDGCFDSAAPILGGIGWSVRGRRDAFILHWHLWIAGLHGWAEVS